jgi:NAD(P)-dependent dehydrogenase (short-subunit alcohol dehydrogenase family)
MLAVNHLGPFLLTNLLLPLLEASAPSRIVTVASHAHRWGRIRFDDLEATGGYGFMAFRHYGDTKLENILFTQVLARRLAGTGVTANSVHPGGVHTNLGAPPKAISAVMKVILKTPEQGARTSLYVATSPEVEGISGAYFSSSKRADGKLSRRAKDEAVAERLWDVSADLVGLAS